MLNFFSNYNVVNRAFELPDPSVIASKRVLITTCGAAGILRCGDYGAYQRAAKAKRTSSFLGGLEFSHVLIDEAGQVTSLLLLHRHLTFLCKFRLRDAQIRMSPAIHCALCN